MEKPDRNPEVPKNELETSEGRRKLLKLLAAGTGAFAAATLLPMRWTKPLVEMGVLPAHAQMSGFSGDLQAVMNWFYSGTVNGFELHMVDPQDGTDVFNGGSSPTLTHSGDAPDDFGGTESVGNTVPGVVAAGTYQVYLRSVYNYNVYTSLTVDITVNGSVTNFNLPTIFFNAGQDARVADITFPAGNLTDRAGQSYP